MAAKLRVLADASLAANPAGTGAFTRGTFAALSRRPDIELITARMDGAAISSVDVGRKGRAARGFNGLRHLRFYAGELPRRARTVGADVVFCPSTLGPWWGRTPTVVTVHDLAPLRYPATLDPFSRVYLQAMFRLQLRRARYLCTVSNAVATEILERQPRRPATTIVVACDGPSPELMATSARPVEGLTQPFFLMVGTVEPRKNHVTAINAFTRLYREGQARQARLVIAGSPGWLVDPIVRAASTSAVADRILRLGPIEPGTLRWLYEHASALLFPSLYEGFGIPVLEAFTLRCPVIAARIPAVAEVAGPGTATLLDPLDADGWAAALAAALDRPADPAQLDAAQRQAKAFTWDAAAERIAGALRAAAGSR